MLGKGYKPESVWYQNLCRQFGDISSSLLPFLLALSTQASFSIVVRCYPFLLRAFFPGVPGFLVIFLDFPEQSSSFAFTEIELFSFFRSAYVCLISYTESKSDSFPHSVSETTTCTKRERKFCIFALTNL